MVRPPTSHTDSPFGSYAKVGIMIDTLNFTLGRTSLDWRRNDVKFVGTEKSPRLL